MTQGINQDINPVTDRFKASDVQSIFVANNSNFLSKLSDRQMIFVSKETSILWVTISEDLT